MVWLRLLANIAANVVVSAYLMCNLGFCGVFTVQASLNAVATSWTSLLALRYR